MLFIIIYLHLVLTRLLLLVPLLIKQKLFVDKSEKILHNYFYEENFSLSCWFFGVGWMVSFFSKTNQGSYLG